MDSLSPLLAAAKRQFDLTRSQDQASVLALTEQLLALPDISQVQLNDVARSGGTPVEFKIAVKLIQSRRYVSTIHEPVKIGVVFAMWGEHNRLLPRSEDNPNGEDALRVKLDQLQWVAAGSAVQWTLYAVDDGCPRHSGRLAERILAECPLGDSARVLFLEEGIRDGCGPLRRLGRVDDSRKGGAIIYGCLRALGEGADAIVYTDADSSVHLGQVGLLLEPYLERGKSAVWGNRKHPDAVLVKEETRWGIGIKALRHMQRMVGHAIFSRGIFDTQAAFKLYDGRVIGRILANPTVFDFSFDTDWILATLAMNEDFETVPFAFIDSFAESASITQGPMTTWEMLLKGLVEAVRARGADHDKEMAAVIEEEIGSSRDLDILIDRLPPELEGVPDERLGDPAIMSPQRMREWIRVQKRGVRR